MTKFLAGCVRIVVSLRERLWERDQWFRPADAGFIGRAPSIRGLITFSSR